MFSLKGPGIKIVAAIVALAALAFGVYSTFFQSAGFMDGTATIVSIEEDPDYIPDPDKTNDKQYHDRKIHGRRQGIYDEAEFLRPLL